MDLQRIAHVTRRFLALRDVRLFRLREQLSPRRCEVLDLLPLLLHINHPQLPAFVGDDVPVGIPGYSPEKHTQLAARKHLGSTAIGSSANRTFELRGLYLMGSAGTLGQDRDSDLDVWLIHGDGLSAVGLARLQTKASAIEAWAKSQDVELHIYLMDAAGFREGRNTALSNDSSGQLQHVLLLEEFYRTAVLLAGRAPIWWLTPPGCGDDHSTHVAALQKTAGVNADDWIDFGPVGEIPPDEFFSSAHWQLHKGIAAPYKSVLKLMLNEAYAAQYPKILWLSDQLKRAVQGDQELDHDRLDPYRMLLCRLTDHLTELGEPDRLDLARRSLYVKTGIRMSDNPDSDDWRTGQLRELGQKWGWSEQHWQNLDGRHGWKLERVIEERDALVAELTRSYHLLTDFARAKGSDMDRNGRELSLLGRRLYAALERRPGKVDLINPGISHNIAEEQLWVSRHASGGQGAHWRLFREPPGALAADAEPLKATGSLIEMLTWLHVNSLTDGRSRIQLLPRPIDTTTPEYVRILQALAKRLPQPVAPDIPINAFADAPTALHSLTFLNVAPPPSLGLRAPDAIGKQTHTLVEDATHLVVSNWGEVLVHNHDNGLEGLLDILCRHLNLAATDKPATPLHAYCFSSGELDALARRISELAEAVLESFASHGPLTRYVFMLQDNYYQIDRGPQGIRWIPVGGSDDLLQLLQEPLNPFRPTVLDPYRLKESPLVRLYQENKEGVVQVFYRTRIDGIEMFCLDDSGSLFHQHFADITEGVFLSQQRRLFDSLANRRLLASALHAGDILADGAHFYQLAVSPEGWTARAIEPPKDAPGLPLELLLITSRDSLDNNRFTLAIGQQEFDGLRLGSRLYREVATHILARRKPGQTYPIRITGVIPAGLEEGTGWSVNEMLRAKRRIERRLTQAMHEIGRPRAKPVSSPLGR